MPRKKHEFTSPMLEELKKYFAETPREKILADWEAVKKFDFVGPTIEEFLKGQNYTKLDK